jgi:Uma2 family endonuclease
MSTTTTVPLPPIAPSMVPSAPEEERGVMRGVSWNLYDRLTDAIDERSSIRVAFDGRDVEIMVVGPVHEGVRGLLGVFISLVAEVLDVDFHQLGATTWKRQEVGRGLESDVSLGTPLRGRAYGTVWCVAVRVRDGSLRGCA